MSKDKVLVSTIVYSAVDPVPYASHMQMWFRCGRHLPDVDFIFHSPWRLPIDTARNTAAKAALESGAKYLFFYDSDMIIHPDIIKNLLSRKKPVVMALCWIRGYPFDPMVFKYKTEERKQMFNYSPTEEDYKNEIFQCDAVGTPCTLIDTEVFRHMPEPYFLTGKYHTEDIYFCCKAREFVDGFECWVDTSVSCGHQLDPLALDKHNVEDLRGLYKNYNNIGQPCQRIDASVEQPNPLEEEVL